MDAMPRPCNCRRISGASLNHKLDRNLSDCLFLGHDEFEALRLADLESLEMKVAAEKMGISRHTFGRILRKARHKVVKAVWLGKTIQISGGNYAINPDNQGDFIMSDSILVAVPSEAPGGLAAAPSAHFGHCACYTIANVENGQIRDVRIVQNQGHEHGGCVQPVQELAKDGVKVLLAGGMGMRPLNAMQQAGIKVYYSVNQLTVEDALKAFAQGKLQAFGSEQLCTGCHGHH